MRILIMLITLITTWSALAEDTQPNTSVENVSMQGVVVEDLVSQELLLQEAAKALDTTVVIPDEMSPVSEAEIPVLASVKTKQVEEKSSFMRVFMSLAVIILLSAGLIFFSKWYAKNHKKNTENTRIRVLTQHFLGPRKSLAIVSVAGETMLIGITDQNISMLKSLSLIDDEFPEAVSNNFAKSLKTADARQAGQSTAAEDEAEDFIISSIKDKVSTKMKNMRNI